MGDLQQVPLWAAQERPLELQPNFSGHESFPFRYSWLPKGVRALQERPDVFTADDAMVVLGVGKNMVRSIRHWTLATWTVVEGDTLSGTRTRPLKPSALGDRLFLSAPDADETSEAWDPYLEDDASLWVLHWHLVTNAARATTWYWAFNLAREHDFTRDSMLTGLQRLAESQNWTRLADTTFRTDIACFLRTYLPGKRGPSSTAEDSLDCPLTGLRLLVDIDGERMRFNEGPKRGLPVAIFAYAAADFWRRRYPEQETLSLRELSHGEGSPGRAFRLDEDSVLRYLDEIAEVTAGRLRFDDTALIRQIVRHGEMEPFEVLDAYYRR